MTYSALKTEIADKSHRGDLTSVIPSLIENAEAYLFRELQAIELEASTTGTITSNVIAFPTGFMGVQKLVIGDNTLAYESGTETETTVTDYPLTYTIESGQIKLVDPVADGTAYTLYYSVSLTNLSDTNTSNWLLEYGKDLYVSACMVEVGRHTKDDRTIARWQALIPSQIESVRSYSQRKKFPVRSGLQIKPRR